MRVQVDETWRHELARCIENAHGAGHGNVGLDRFDNAVADADIVLATERLARIEHLAAFDHQIELVLRSHDGMGGTGKRSRRGGRSCSNEKLSPTPARRRFAYGGEFR